MRLKSSWVFVVLPVAIVALLTLHLGRRESVNVQKAMEALQSRTAASQPTEALVAAQAEAHTAPSDRQATDVLQAPEVVCPPPPPPEIRTVVKTEEKIVEKEKIVYKYRDRPAQAQAQAPAPPQQQAAKSSKTSPAVGIAEEKPFTTAYRCFRSADFAELCVYTNICWDGDKVVFFDDDKEAGSSVPRHFQVGDNAVGHHTFDVYPRPPKPSQGLPLNTRAEGYYRPTSVLQGMSSTQIQWSDESMWIVDPEYRGWEIQHPLFWAHSIMGMWEAQVSNDTWGGIVPPLERVYIPMDLEIELGGWNQGTLDLVLPPSATVYMQKQTNAAGLSSENLMCAKRAVVTGSKSVVFSGLQGCYLFRKMTYEKFGLTHDDRHHWGPGKPPEEKYAPHHLVIRARKGRRGFVNQDQMIALVESYKIPYTLVSGHGTFEEQVRLMSKAGVLLLAHGAAATNTMFQPHRSVLIEVFPFLRKRFGFGQLAAQCGVWYYPIFSWERDPNDQSKSGANSPLFEWKCMHRSSVDANYEGACDSASKEAKIVVPIDVLEQTLIDAFDTIGKRIYKNGIRKPRPPMPAEGRKEMLDTWTDPWLDE